MRKRKQVFNKGITLIALVITIIVLLILAGVSIATLTGEGGILRKAKTAGVTQEEQEAREKLELVLQDLTISKHTDPTYDQNKTINDTIEKENMTVIEDMVIVDGWQFEIDRSVPKIGISLGKGKENEAIGIVANAMVTADYVKANIEARITFEGKIQEIIIKGTNVEVPTPENGVYTMTQEVEENGIYTILVKDEEGNYKMAKVEVTEITEDMDIWNKADMEKFRDLVNSGRTFENRTVRVMANIDLESSETDPWGQNIGTSVTTFKGEFNGQNYEINNLYINIVNLTQVAGLFRTNEGTIKNVRLKTGKINCQPLNQQIVIGGICAYNAQNGTITHCVNEGVSIFSEINVATKGDGGASGGIVGSNHGLIENCGNLAKIEGISRYETNMVSSGIVGYNHGNIKKCYNKGEIVAESARNTSVSGIGNCMGNGRIEDCYNTGNLTGNETGTFALYIGGITAFNRGSIDNCYSVGRITKGSNTDISYIGISLGIQMGKDVTRCYYLKDLGYTGYGKIDSSVSNSVTTVTPQKTETELKALAPTLGEAFTNDVQEEKIWKYNNGYPVLKWQVE